LRHGTTEVGQESKLTVDTHRNRLYSIHTMKKKPKKTKETTTYDPLIHTRRGSGYHMKKNAPEEDSSGASIRHILYPKGPAAKT